MREKMKTFFCVLLIFLMLPYLMTMLMQGADAMPLVKNVETADEIPVTEEQVEAEQEELILVGMLANQIAVTAEREALLAQSVLVRTNYQYAKNKGEKLPEGKTAAQMQEIWGTDYTKNYEVLKTCLEETDNQVLMWENQYIYAAYHAVSTGTTRNIQETTGNENYPYLTAVECEGDLDSPDYLSVVYLNKSQVVARIQEEYPELALTEETLLEQIQITERDSAGYVVQMQIDTETVGGDQFRQWMELGSDCFYIKEVDGKVRFVTKGVGHGLGLSQYTANLMAKSGSSYEEILAYFYPGVSLVEDPAAVE